jgi:hypothetical protein
MFGVTVHRAICNIATRLFDSANSAIADKLNERRLVQLLKDKRRIVVVQATERQSLCVE